MTHIRSKEFKATQIYIRISYLNSECLTLIGPKRWIHWSWQQDGQERCKGNLRGKIYRTHFACFLVFLFISSCSSVHLSLRLLTRVLIYLFICGIVFKAGTASWGTDEGKFIRIFTLRSRPQLGATFPEYKKVSQSNVIIKQCLSLKVKTSTCYFCVRLRGCCCKMSKWVFLPQPLLFCICHLSRENSHVVRQILFFKRTQKQSSKRMGNFLRPKFLVGVVLAVLVRSHYPEKLALLFSALLKTWPLVSRPRALHPCNSLNN